VSTLHHCFDAAFPPSQVPSDCDSVLGYVGGSLADHVWTPQEWQPFGDLAQFPCWVCDLTANPVDQARDASAAARKLGWNTGRAMIGDTETAVDPVWWDSFARQLDLLDWVAVDYGSQYYVVQNKPAIMWVADWNGIPNLPDSETWGDQYIANREYQNTTIDLSVINHDLYLLGGEGKRRG
jgi:hypothetical protein